MKLMPASKARFTIGRLAFSSSTHSRQDGWPIPIAPRPSRDTFRFDAPNLLYSIVPSDCLRLGVHRENGLSFFGYIRLGRRRAWVGWPPGHGLAIEGGNTTGAVRRIPVNTEPSRRALAKIALQNVGQRGSCDKFPGLLGLRKKSQRGAVRQDAFGRRVRGVATKDHGGVGIALVLEYRKQQRDIAADPQPLEQFGQNLAVILAGAERDRRDRPMLRLRQSRQEDAPTIIHDAANDNCVATVLFKRLCSLAERHVTPAIVAKRAARIRRKANYSTDNDDMVAGIKSIMPGAIENAQAISDQWRPVGHHVDLDAVELVRGIRRERRGDIRLPVAKDIDAKSLRAT